MGRFRKWDIWEQHKSSSRNRSSRTKPLLSSLWNIRELQAVGSSKRSNPPLDIFFPWTGHLGQTYRKAELWNVLEIGTVEGTKHFQIVMSVLLIVYNLIFCISTPIQ